MSDRLLRPADEYLHTTGEATSWNESRYADFFDPVSKLAGWLRIGMRPNEGHAEMTVCVHLPDGRTAFAFERAAISANGLTAGGQSWRIGEPYRDTQVRYSGSLMLMDDPWGLTEPKTVFATAPRSDAAIDLDVHSRGIDAVMGSDQEHIDRIFLPGQADWHYQHLCWTTGSVTVDGRTYPVVGRGGKDHSWGPRNWLAKIYMRWFTAVSDDRDFGFMLTRAVGPTKQTCSGHVWENGEFVIIDDFTMTNTYRQTAPYELLRTEVVARAGEREWRATGTPQAWLPLRHRSRDEHGEPSRLRIVKSPTLWEFSDGGSGVGMSEIHDRLDGDRPVGLAD